MQHRDGCDGKCDMLEDGTQTMYGAIREPLSFGWYIRVTDMSTLCFVAMIFRQGSLSIPPRGLKEIECDILKDSTITYSFTADNGDVRFSIAIRGDPEIPILPPKRSVTAAGDIRCMF